MDVDNVREFPDHGKVTRSVNSPDAVVPRSRPHRRPIQQRNVPNMVAQILTALAAESINTANLLNHSRGDISYTIVDLDAPASADTLKRIRAIDGILSTRVMPIVES